MKIHVVLRHAAVRAVIGEDLVSSIGLPASGACIPSLTEVGPSGELPRQLLVHRTDVRHRELSQRLFRDRATLAVNTDDLYVSMATLTRRRGRSDIGLTRDDREFLLVGRDARVRNPSRKLFGSLVALDVPPLR